MTHSPTGNTAPYVYPGTNVLRNLRDLATLGAFEADATSWRIRQLEHQATPGKLNLAHLKAIHRHIFEDVYPWAGEFRTVNIARPGQFYFAFTEQIPACLDTIFSELAHDQAFNRNVLQTEFCARAAVNDAPHRSFQEADSSGLAAILETAIDSFTAEA